MKNNILNEEIKRIKKLLNITESSVIEEANPIVNILRRFTPNIEKQFLSTIEQKLGKKLSMATDDEIEKIIKSAEMSTYRRQVAKAIYNAEKDSIDEIFKKYDMTIPAEAVKAYNEIRSLGINKGFIKDIAQEWKVGKTPTSVGVSVKPQTSFTIPELNIPELPDVWKMSNEQVFASLKNRFPKASNSDIQKMVNNLEKIKIKDQATFDREFKAAIKGFKPLYDKILEKPSMVESAKKVYNKMPTPFKYIFWIVSTTGGYQLLKGIGVPVDKFSSWLYNSVVGIYNDQVKGFKSDKSGATQTSSRQEPEQNW